MSSLASTISVSSAARTDFSATSQLSPGSRSSDCSAIIPKSTAFDEKRSGMPSIMAKRLLSLPAAINLDKLIDPLSKMPEEFKKQMNSLNSIKSSSAPIALVLEGPDEKLNSIDTRFLIASLSDIHLIAIRILNRPIKELIREVSEVMNKEKIKLLLFRTHGNSDFMVTYTGRYSSKDICREDFEALDRHGQIILISCQTGNNIGRKIAEVSNIIVCAPLKELFSLHTYITQCPDHHCLEMRTYEYKNNQKTQHARIFKSNEVREPCNNDEQEIAARQFEYFKNFLIDSEDMFVFGVLMKKKGQTRKARKWYLKAAKLGNVKAMINLGVLLGEKGNKQGVKNWYFQAAKLGDVQAMLKLGAFLEEEGNKQEAKNWYFQAAKLENPQAMTFLGFLLLVEGNQQEATNWFLKAAKLGSPSAIDFLEILLKKEDKTRWYLVAGLISVIFITMLIRVFSEKSVRQIY
jgi:hypothetical protein